MAIILYNLFGFWHLFLFQLFQGGCCLFRGRSCFLIISRLSSLNKHWWASLDIRLFELLLMTDYVLLDVLARSRSFSHFLPSNRHKSSLRCTKDSCLTRELTINTVCKLFSLVLTRAWNEFYSWWVKATSVLIEPVSSWHKTNILSISQWVSNHGSWNHLLCWHIISTRSNLLGPFPFAQPVFSWLKSLNSWAKELHSVRLLFTPLELALNRLRFEILSRSWSDIIIRFANHEVLSGLKLFLFVPHSLIFNSWRRLTTSMFHWDYISFTGGPLFLIKSCETRSEHAWVVVLILRPYFISIGVVITRSWSFFFSISDLCRRFYSAVNNLVSDL